jgi:hypothetical protein
MKFGSNPMHNLKQINSFFKHKHYATTWMQQTTKLYWKNFSNPHFPLSRMLTT